MAPNDKFRHTHELLQNVLFTNHPHQKLIKQRNQKDQGEEEQEVHYRMNKKYNSTPELNEHHKEKDDNPQMTFYVVEDDDGDYYYDDDSQQQLYYDEEYYENYYLYPEQIEYLMPILFEDGMDYVECELYYASIASKPRASRRNLRIRPSQQQQLLLGQGLSPLSSSPFQQSSNGEFQLKPCIKSKSTLRSMHDSNATTNKESAMRRCSFSGMPQVTIDCPQLEEQSHHAGLVRSNSDGCLDETARVSFHGFVHVVTIYAADEYPDDIRQSLWMSRHEISQNKERAMSDESRRKRQKTRKNKSKKYKS